MRNYRVTWNDAMEGHQYAMRDGGRPGIRDENAIHSALARPRAIAFELPHFQVKVQPN